MPKPPLLLQASKAPTHLEKFKRAHLSFRPAKSAKRTRLNFCQSLPCSFRPPKLPCTWKSSNALILEFSAREKLETHAFELLPKPPLLLQAKFPRTWKSSNALILEFSAREKLETHAFELLPKPPLLLQASKTPTHFPPGLQSSHAPGKSSNALILEFSAREKLKMRTLELSLRSPSLNPKSFQTPLTVNLSAPHTQGLRSLLGFAVWVEKKFIIGF